MKVLNPSRVIGLALWSLGLLTSAVAQVTVMSPQEKLEAVRQALVSAAMEAPTQVQSTSWIDGQGVLRESSSFKSGMTVRGVRVMAYSQDAQGKPKAEVRWQTDESSLRPRTQKSAAAPMAANKEPTAACTQDRHNGRLQHLVGVQVSSPGSWTADTLPMMLDLKEQAQLQLEQTASKSSNWRMLTVDDSPGNSYEKALLGIPQMNLPLRATFTLSKAIPAPRDPRTLVIPGTQLEWTPSFGYNKPSPMLLQMDVSVSARGQSKPLFQERAFINLQPETRQWASTQADQASLNLVKQQVDTWATSLNQQLGCLAVLPEVIKADSQEIRINAGTLAGVQLGDEWLLADGKTFPKNLLEPSSTLHTALATVREVKEHYALLTLTAGNRASVRPNWRAWPANIH